MFKVAYKPLNFAFFDNSIFKQTIQPGKNSRKIYIENRKLRRQFLFVFFSPQFHEGVKSRQKKREPGTREQIHEKQN